jgi:ppGpp synthetase/RelA/SpoT-type nucleotidyltranferase
VSISKRSINRAGDLLRDWWTRPEVDLSPEETEAVDLVWAYRASFQDPLTKVVMGVRSNMRAEHVPVVVAQRLKRLRTIMDKLHRQPGMELARMHDIGGCRAIVPAGAFGAIDGIRRRIRRSVSQVVREYDYVETPKDTGYRAVHMVVLREDHLIEVQLRTAEQHRWSETVERLGGRIGHNLKDGQGPEELLDYLRRAAYLISEIEAGRQPPPGLRSEYDALGNEVRHYFAD